MDKAETHVLVVVMWSVVVLCLLTLSLLGLEILLHT